jgi:hypothetical protein
MQNFLVYKFTFGSWSNRLSSSKVYHNKTTPYHSATPLYISYKSQRCANNNPHSYRLPLLGRRPLNMDGLVGLANPEAFLS